MKPLLTFLLLLTLAAARPAADTYRLNPAASRVTWTGYAEVGGYAPTGTVQLRQGTFAYDGRTLRAGRFEFDMRTIAQEQAQLAEHLRGPDFFDAATYPTAVFVLGEVRDGLAGRGIVVSYASVWRMVRRLGLRHKEKDDLRHWAGSAGCRHRA